MQFEYTDPYQQRISAGKITQEELNYSLNHLNNVALSTRILIQVHKPGRIDYTEFKRALDGHKS